MRQRKESVTVRNARATKYRHKNIFGCCATCQNNKGEWYY